MTSKKHQKVLKIKEDKENYFPEEYQIRFTNGKIIYVYVKVRNGDGEKCHHQEAIEIAKKEYPDLEVLRCYYC